MGFCSTFVAGEAVCAVDKLWRHHHRCGNQVYVCDRHPTTVGDSCRACALNRSMTQPVHIGNKTQELLKSLLAFGSAKATIKSRIQKSLWFKLDSVAILLCYNIRNTTAKAIFLV